MHVLANCECTTKLPWPSPDSQVQASVAQVFSAISQHSPDTAASVMADFVPLVFLAMHATASEEGVVLCDDIFL